MGIWKGRKTQNDPVLSQMCPKCLSANLHMVQEMSGLYYITLYKCYDCGYKGAVYVDANEGNAKEELQLQMLREEFPEDVEDQRTVQELAQECLEVKWIPNQVENHNSLRAWCPFCADANVVCSICQCPPTICANYATEGLIGKLNQRYSNEIELCEVDPDLYEEIVMEFKKLLN